MNYHPDDFLNLISEVEAQGGAHLSESCQPTVFTLRQPIDDKNLDGPYTARRVATTGCKRSAKFLVPLLPEAYFDDKDLTDTQVALGFEPGTFKTKYRLATEEDFDFDDTKNPNSAMGDGTPSLAKVCAIDDAMGLWPRFRDAMETDESFEVVDK